MNRLAFLSVLSACLTLDAWAAVQVSNVVWRQEADTRQVVCTYALDTAAIVMAEVRVGGVPLDGAHVGAFIGDVNRIVPAGEGHWLSWRPDKDWPGEPQDVTLRLKALEPERAPDYLVVDLSGDRMGDVRYYTRADALPFGGLTNDIYRTAKLVLRRIPAAGVVWNMGAPTSEVGRRDDEPQHRVVLTTDYWMAVFATTQAQYERVTGTNPSYPPNVDPLKPVDRVFGGIRDKDAHAAADETFAEGAFRTAVPVERSFLGILRAKTGLDFDLPTEAQWEFACRAGTTSAYNNGNDKLPVAVLGSFKDFNGYTADADSGASLLRVGSRLPNAWGLYDMHGNVYEWCLDSYAAEDYGAVSLSAVLVDPCNTVDVDGTSRHRVRRGGSYRASAADGRSASRFYWNAPFQGTGFRVLCRGAVRP